MRIAYICPFGATTGYAMAAQTNLIALKPFLKPEDKLFIVPIPLPRDSRELYLHPRFSSLAEHVVDTDPHDVSELEPTIIVAHIIPKYAPLFAIEAGGAKTVVYTTWETDRLPRDVVENLDAAFEAMIVPCDYNKLVFASCGYDRPIHVVPHAHDPTWWSAEPTCEKTDVFTFYWIGVWGERKNPIGLLKAYLTEFTGDDDVQLVMSVGRWNKEDVEALVRAIGLANLPRLRVLDGPGKTDEQIRELHWRAHCYASCARGEGFGLGAHEAALVGNAVIAPGFAGHLDALQDYMRWDPGAVPYQMTPAIAQEPQTVSTVQIAGLTIPALKHALPHGITGDQLWAEPDLAALREEMRRQYEAWRKDPRAWHQDMIAARASKFREAFTYNAVGEKLYRILEAV